VLLSPTDASLGQAVVTNPSVPVRIRQALNIESGLNDGIAMPFLLLAISMAFATEQVGVGIGSFLGHVLVQILLGIVAGVLIGLLGVLLVEWGDKRGWMSDAFQKISAIALVLLAYGVAELVGGNGFVAAFCFGMTVGNWRKSEVSEELYEYVEVEVQLLMLLTFLIFGAVLLPPALEQMNGSMALYALLSLTLVRMVPVAISFIGSKVRPMTSLFVGWFGPRGVASILYIYTVMDTEGLRGKELIYAVTMITVLFSVFAHGVTAAPLANWYGKFMADRTDVAPGAAEKEEVPEIPLRVEPA
jgi:NhaP-type Na+/H+ or K+/H+ antiporter